TNGQAIVMKPGPVVALSPLSHDGQQESTAYNAQVTMSIHVYVADIGTVKPAVYDLDSTEKLFISGDTNALSTATPHQ
ncbi:cysteine dioxygenase, partial [Pseudomonas syringae pv. tagetis]